MPSSENLWRAYGEGKEPPFLPFLIGTGLFLFGNKIAVARFLMVVLSAMTTPLVYLLTTRFTTQKAAIIAAFLHIFYPSFIGFSHYVYSETPYIFLLLLAIYFTVLLSDAQVHSKRIIYSIPSGLFLGLSGLTRAAVLPFLFIVPFWLFLTIKEKGMILLPSIVIVSWLIVLIPYQTAIVLKDRTNAGILSTITGWYLHLGNNPWVPDGYGSSWLHDSRGHMLEAAKDYGKTHSLTIDRAQRILAIQEIKRDFKAFLIRGIYKLRMFWTSDFFVLQYFFHAAYPPVHPAIVAFIWGAILISYITVIILTISGFLIPGLEFSKKSLILLLVISSMAQSVVTFGISRLHLPLLALMLPIAGFGVENIKQKISFIRRTGIILIALLFCVSVFTSFPLVMNLYLRPSSYYCGLIKQADRILGANTICNDKVIFRAKDTYHLNNLSIAIQSNGYTLHPTQPDPWMHVPKILQYEWEISQKNKILLLDIYAYHTSAPLRMSLSSERHEQKVTIYPIRKSSWRQWQPSGLNGIEYMWLGGERGTFNRLPEEELTKFEF